MIHFLIVDDEPDVEILMKQRFKEQLRKGIFYFNFASNGVHALEILEKEHAQIKIVLTDINMPEMDGLVLLQHIQDKYPHIFTIVISAYGDMDNIRTAMNLGAFDFITKPIDFEDLKKTIQKTISRFNALKILNQKKENLHDMVRELHLARDIQETIIPTEFILEQNLEVFGLMQPAKQIGGDFFDFFWYDKNKLGFLIADVSGKGMPSALFMTISRTLLRAYASIHEEPSACIEHVNNFLCSNNVKMMFVTVYFGILDVTTGVVTAVNAGHNKPALVDNAKCSFIGSQPQLALGILPNSVYQSHTYTLKKNQTLMLYTDGVTEANNIENEQFRESKLSTFLEAHSSVGCIELVQGLSMSLRIFSAGVPQSDDITMLAIRFKEDDLDSGSDAKVTK